MIRALRENDLNDIMQIWLEANIKAHNFIPEEYWTDNYAMVKAALPKAEVYVYEDDNTNQIKGFIGLTDNYIEGLFVSESFQSGGIGKQLLDYAKEIKTEMSLSVYKKNKRALNFYQREKFVLRAEKIDCATGEKELTMLWTKQAVFTVL